MSNTQHVASLEVQWSDISDADATGMTARSNAMLDRQIADASATRSLTLAFLQVLLVGLPVV